MIELTITEITMKRNHYARRLASFFSQDNSENQ